VKRYRQRIQRVGSASGHRERHLHFRGRTLARVDPFSPLREKSQSESYPPSAVNLPQHNAAQEGQTKGIPETFQRAQAHLEALPGHILHHAKTFRTYVRLFVNDGNHSSTQGDGVGGIDEVSSTLRGLLDEIALLGGISRATKEEILRDRDARHVSCFIYLFIIYSFHSYYVDSIRAEH